jgi:hypothetical protein
MKSDRLGLAGWPSSLGELDEGDSCEEVVGVRTEFHLAVDYLYPPVPESPCPVFFHVSIEKA